MTCRRRGHGLSGTITVFIPAAERVALLGRCGQRAGLEHGVPREGAAVQYPYGCFGGVIIFGRKQFRRLFLPGVQHAVLREPRKSLLGNFSDAGRQ